MYEQSEKRWGEVHNFMQSTTTPDLGHQMGKGYPGKEQWKWIYKETCMGRHKAQTHTHSDNKSGKESITTPYPGHHMGKAYPGKGILESDCRSNL